MTTYQDNPPQYFPLTIPNNSVPNVAGYYVTVTDTGTTNIFRKSESGGVFVDTKIGEIPKNGSFVPATGGASTEETQYFSGTLNATNLITNQAVPVVDRGIGGDAGGGNSKINDILGTNLAVPEAVELTQTAATVEFQSIPYETDENEPPKIRSSYEDYYYPSSLKTNTNKQDVIKFTLKEVKGGTIDPNLGQKTFTKNYEDRQGSVTLPIQPSITDSNIVEWSGFGLGPLGSFLAGQSLKLSSSANAAQLFSNAGDAFVSTFKELLDSPSSTAYQQQIKLAIAEAASGTQGLLSRATGNVINENFELLFAGPQLRPFTFSFKMSPRSKDEAKQVRSIIRFFKQAMSVKTSSTNLFLKSPFVFDIKYLVNGSSTVHPSINRIKTCALLGCDVDYTPDGTYMTFNDDKRTMTSYGMTLRFSEIEPIYEKDYIDNNIPEDEIGF
jgi:hypothetical protein